MNLEDINTHLDEFFIDPNWQNKSHLLIFTNQGRLFKWYDRKKFTSMLSNKTWSQDIVLNPKEKLIYATGIDEYKGFLVFAFTNGKVAKINMTAYETKFERQCLINAFHLEATLIFIKYIPADLDLIIYSSLKKILAFNTEIINPLSTKNSSGVQILKLKGNAIAAGVKLLRDVSIKDLSYYKRNQAAIGYYIKPDDIVF